MIKNMCNTKAKEIISLIESGMSVTDVKTQVATSDNDWFRYANKAYIIKLQESKKERTKFLKQSNTCGTSNKEIDELLALNMEICKYALSVPPYVSKQQVDWLKNYQNNTPYSKFDIVVNNIDDKEKKFRFEQFSVMNILEKIIFDMRMRALQKKGRFEQFEPFKIFSNRIQAATLSYYQENFISCFLTLVPIVEGIIFRWDGNCANNYQPDFERIRKFFKNSPLRQPCPQNIQFHKVFTEICDKILNEHFYKPTDKGNYDSFAYFNRHIASHSLIDEECATKENCIRIFLLLDTMAEIYKFESRINSDPRFNLTDDDINNDLMYYNLTKMYIAELYKKLPK